MKKLNKLILEAYYGLPIEKCIELELQNNKNTNWINERWHWWSQCEDNWELLEKCDYEDYIDPISLSRVIKILEKEHHFLIARHGEYLAVNNFVSGEHLFFWQLSKDNKELYLDDQSEETKESLIKLFEN